MAWNNGNSGGNNYGGGQQQYGNGGGGGGGGGGNQRGGRVSFAGGTASFNKQPKGERSRHFGGTLKFPNGDARWLSAWINAPKDNPNGNGAIQQVLGIMAQNGLYLSIDVGDIAPARQDQGQGGNNYGGGNGGGYGGNNQQGQYNAQQGQQGQGFQFGNGGGGPGSTQGGFC